MDRRINYAMVGGFVIVLGFLLIALIFWLSTAHEGEHYLHYKVYAREDVSGLSVASPVRYSGVEVGSVESIVINPKDEQEVKIVLKVKNSTPITTSTVASLVTEGITGVQFVGLKSLKQNAPRLVPTHDNRMPTIPDQPSLFVRLSSMLDKVALNISDLTTSLNKMVDKQNREAVSHTLKNVKQFTDVLSDNSKQIDAIIKHLSHTMKRVDKASETLPQTMASINDSMVSVKALTHSLKQTSDEAKDMVKSTHVLVNQVSSDVLPNVNRVFRKAGRVADNLEVITDHVRQNPGVLLRGQKPAVGGPGE